jgi:hypothetical protein
MTVLITDYYTINFDNFFLTIMIETTSTTHVIILQLKTISTQKKKNISGLQKMSF